MMTLGQLFTLLWKSIVAVTVWGAALFFCLQIRHWNSSVDHVVCGPWGCGPPLFVLVACHCFWIVLLVPPTVILAYRLPVASLRTTGRIVTLLGLTALLGIGGWDISQWWPMVSDWQHKFLLQRLAFATATFVDLPTVELLLIGCGLLLRARMIGHRRASRPAPGQSRL